jgi:L-lactate dehydrogenase complex protein LldG
MSAREHILARVRAATRSAPEAADKAAQHVASHPRSPLPPMNWEDHATRFAERARSLSSTVENLASAADIPAAVARYLDEQKLENVAVCWPALAHMAWTGRVEARAARGDDLVGITGAYCAIAETGTLMLLSSRETPASVSLLPETHVAIVPAARIVARMEDAWDLLRREVGTLPRAVNFVSGPSRTADIEQTVTLGAHGPYRVHILVIGG